MSHASQSHSAQTRDPAQPQPIDAREFLTTCALCSLGGLTVLAGLAQTLVWLWGSAA
jgi:hypothetical protein